MERVVVGSSALVASSQSRIFGLVASAPGDGDALLLTAGELRRIVARAVGEADDLEQLLRALFCVRAAHARDLERKQIFWSAVRCWSRLNC